LPIGDPSAISCGKWPIGSRHFRDELIGRKGFDDWVEAFEYVAAHAQQRFLWIIDDFPYLAEGNAATSSLFQKGWDEHLRHTPTYLVLSGAPLYGRRTGDLRVDPMPVTELAGFFPGRKFPTLLAIYAAFGGMPAYLRELEPRASLETNVRDCVLPARLLPLS